MKEKILARLMQRMYLHPRSPPFCRCATSPYNLESGLETNNMANREQRGNKEKKKPKQEKDKKDKTPAPPFPFVQPQLVRKPHKGKQQG